MKRVITVLVALLTLTVVFVGCKPAGGTTTQNAPVVFKFGVRNSWPDSRNPYTSSWAISTSTFHSIHYEGLMWLTPSLDIQGRLAESWTMSPDGLKWTFNLRKGVKWSDGVDFTADDVVFSYRAIIDNQLPRLYGEVNSIIDIKKIDSHTVEFTLDKPRADYLLMFVAEIVAEHQWNVNKTKDDFLKYENPNPVGTGAFVLVEEVVDEFARYKANDNYWGGRPNVDELIFVFFANDDTKLQALEAGEIDMTSLTAAQLNYAGSLSNVSLVKFGTIRLTELGFNMWNDKASKGNPIIRDIKEIRLAIDHAINYDELIEFSKGGLANPEKGLIPHLSTPWSYWPDAGKLREFSPQKAVQLLEKAGFDRVGADGIRSNARGQKLSFRASIIESSYKDQGLLVQKYLKDIGIEMVITFVDTGRQSAIIEEQDFDTDMYIWGWTADYEDPGFMLSVMTTEQVGGRSDCYFSNAEYDRLYVEQRSMMDRDKRVQAVHRMQEIIYENAPYLILYSDINVMAVNNRCTGYVQMPAGFGGIQNIHTYKNIKKN